MALIWPNKDPQEVLDYTIKWEPRLDGDTIDMVSFTVSEGDVIIDSYGTANANKDAVVWLSGGTNGIVCTVLCRINTVGGRTMDQSVRIKIKDR